MISMCKDCDYTIQIADIISTLLTMEKDEKSYKVKIWVGSEIPFEFTHLDDVEFLQEGVRIESSKKITYLWYDTIQCVEVKK